MIPNQPSPPLSGLKTLPQPVEPGNFAPPSTNAARQMRDFCRAVAVLVVIFIVPLAHLFNYARSSEMYSYMLLIPVVTWYLIHLQKPSTLPTSPPNRLPGFFLLAASLPFVIASLTVEHWAPHLDEDAKLDFPIIAFLLDFAGLAFLYLGPGLLKVCRFPLWMMIFLLPIPIVIMDFIVVFLQQGSAAIAQKFFELSGTPVFHQALSFEFPGGGSITVAPECSGIHASYILLIVSLLAGHLFLRSPWRKGILAAAVLPLALVRNGFRVFTIGELCVHYGMQMIDSPIHRKGGPIFFVLSMVPFFLLLVWLRRGDRRPKTGGAINV